MQVRRYVYGSLGPKRDETPGRLGTDQVTIAPAIAVGLLIPS